MRTILVGLAVLLAAGCGAVAPLPDGGMDPADAAPDARPVGVCDGCWLTAECGTADAYCMGADTGQCELLCRPFCGSIGRCLPR